MPDKYGKWEDEAAASENWEAAKSLQKVQMDIIAELRKDKSVISL